MSKKASAGATDGPIIIKKYANRRLYNTATSAYVTLEDLSDMVKEGVEFVVHDAKTGDDITRSVLTQIIFEQEAKGQNLLPVNFLRDLIKFYGDAWGAVIPRFLEMSMEQFTQEQDKLRAQFGNPLAHMANMANNPMLPSFEAMTRQNMALFEQAMSMFTQAAKKAGTAPQESSSSQREMDELKQQLAEMQRKLNDLAR